ncbi:MAG: hypothetical protein H7210_06835 [Pyrinomonadaceae bacterium]|nr:hypothetical protein [Phycisphaerales bacterium]
MCHRLVLMMTLVTGVPAASLPAQPSNVATAPANPERRQFSQDAPPGKAFTWTSTPADAEGDAGRMGLEYVWSLPLSYDPSKSYDLLVILHGVGKDATWGHGAIDPARLGKEMIVISPAGTNVLAAGVRSFSDDQTNYMAFRQFMLEMTRTFPADRIVLFGYEQGGSFALSFANQFPSLTEGVVVHGARPWLKEEDAQGGDGMGWGGIRQLPIVFLHGTHDETTPYRVSAHARGTYAEDGHQGVWLRPLYGCGHEPDAARVGEAVDWCIGMQAMEAEKVLEVAGELLTKAGTTGTCDAAPPLGAVSRLLSRLMGESEDNPAHFPLDEVDPEIRASARKMLSEIDALVLRHLSSITPEAARTDEFVLSGKAWLGHLVSLREDCRGVRALEAFVRSSGLGILQGAHEKRAAALWEAWEAPTPRERFEGVLDALPHCFLLEGYTPEFLSQMKAWHQKAGELKLSEESLERFENILLLEKGWRDGLAQYRKLWNKK